MKFVYICFYIVITKKKLWHSCNPGHHSHVYHYPDDVRSVAMSPDGQTLVSGGSDTTIKVWNVQTGQLLHTLSEHTGVVLSVAISPDGQALVSGSNDKTIKIWNVRTGQLLRTLSGHLKEVHSVAISPSGLVASGDKDGTIYI